VERAAPRRTETRSVAGGGAPHRRAPRSGALHLFAWVLAWILVPAALAETGREVVETARRLSKTERRWNDRTQKLTLQIIDRRGGVREREIELAQKKYDADRSKTILFFRAPAEIKGTAFLQWVDPHGQNQQWLYLPELKRVRQISGSSKRDSFMGTDFSYEDLAVASEILDWTDADADVSLERQEACDPDTCSVLLFRPRAKEIAYAGLRVWVDGEHRLRRFEFLNDKDAVLKRLVISRYQSIGAIPTPFRFEMENLRSGSRTIVDFEDVRYDQDLGDSLFTERRLEKGM